MDEERYRQWHMLLYAAAAVVISRFSITFLVCTVPIHLMHDRYPGRAFFIAAVPTVAVIIGWNIVEYVRLGIESADFLIVALGMFNPVMLLTTVVLFHLPLPMRRLYRILLTGLLPLVTGLVLISQLHSGSEAAERVLAFYSAMLGDMLATFSNGAFTQEGMQLFVDLSLRVLTSTYMIAWMFFMGLGLLISDAVANRMYRRDKPLFIERFSVPDMFLWPLIASWILVLFDIIFGLGAADGTLSRAVWNIALVLLMVYGTAGLSIAYYVIQRRGRRVHPISLIMLVVLLLFFPGINVVIMILLPLLGVSEHWIHYRNGNKEISNEDNFE